jgi:hypothetical protein
MHNNKVSIQFASLTNLWSFKNELGLNVYSINSLERTIIFEWNQDKEIGAFIEKYNGQIFRAMQNVS